MLLSSLHVLIQRKEITKSQAKQKEVHIVFWKEIDISNKLLFTCQTMTTCNRDVRIFNKILFSKWCFLNVSRQSILFEIVYALIPWCKHLSQLKFQIWLAYAFRNFYGFYKNKWAIITTGDSGVKWFFSCKSTIKACVVFNTNKT